LLWRLTRRAGIRLFELVGFERTRLVRDALLGVARISVSLAFILGGTYAAGWLVSGPLAQPYLFGPLPLPAAVSGVLVWPCMGGLTEQMTYNGSLVPRFQVLCRRTSVAIAVVAFAWSWHHAFMPLTCDAKFMAFRLLPPVPFSVCETLVYPRLRRVVPRAMAHALRDGASVLIGVLLPLVGGHEEAVPTARLATSGGRFGTCRRTTRCSCRAGIRRHLASVSSTTILE
jgi:uncharacterized protein